jgi:DNA polymerase-3 subunit alpha
MSLALNQQKLRETGQTTMFDLWGQSVPTPVPEFGLPHIEDIAKEKLSWEKELLGVYISDNPLASVLGKLNSTNTTLCGQISGDMAGEGVVVAGMVTDLQQRVTRDKRPFAITTLEDLDGRVEVAVWPNVYQDSAELWQEGTIVLVEGKVKVRDDRVSISCERAVRYSPEENRNEAGEKAKSPTPALARNGRPEKRTLVIRVAQTQDEDSDLGLFYSIMDLLKDHPGRDRVHVEISENGITTHTELTRVTTDCCPELLRSLSGLLGLEGIEVLEQNG